MNKPRYTYRDGLLEKGFYKAKELIKEGDEDEARDVLDACIAIVANEKHINGKTEDEMLEGVTIGVWLKRFWNTLENNNLLLS